MYESHAEPPPVEFKDRQGGLIGFGILLIIVGCVCALFIPFVMWSLTMARHAGEHADTVRTMWMATAVYGVLAVALVWLGIGSIMCRRWARALTLILAWMWLLGGVFLSGVLMIAAPLGLRHMTHAQNPAAENARTVGMIIGIGLLAAIFVVLPGLLVLFYQSRHVKATCEARDPVVRWTDACPLPVLALSLMLGFGAASMLTSVLAGHGVAPVFGRFLAGARGVVVMSAIALLWCYCAWATYKLKPAGWWTTILANIIWALSAVVTYACNDIADMYRAMGSTEERIEHIKRVGLSAGHNMAWFTAIMVVPYLGYLLFVKRYFRRPD